MNYDFLKPVLGEELFGQVSEKLKDASGITLVNTADGSYIPKSKFDAEIEKVKQRDTTIADLQTQLEAEKTKNKTVDELNGKITQLTADLANRDSEIKTMGLNYRVKDELRKANARNVDVVFSQLDMSKVTEKDGKLEGFDEQVEALKKSDSYLFAGQPGSHGGFDGRQDLGDSGHGGTNADVNAALRQAAGRG